MDSLPVSTSCESVLDVKNIHTKLMISESTAINDQYELHPSKKMINGNPLTAGYSS